MGQLDSVVFGNKKFSDILEEIYNNQKKKDVQVTALISELKPLINEIGDATLIVPLIKEYMDVLSSPTSCYGQFYPSLKQLKRISQ